MKQSNPRSKVPRRAIIYGIVFGLIVIIVLYAFSAIVNELNKGNGDLAPDFTLDDLDGNAVTLSQFRGHPVLLDFMSTTNQTCIKNMQNLVELHDNYSKRDVSFLSITFGGETAPVVKQYMQGWKATWTGLLGTNPVKKDYGIKVLPTYVMIDPKGGIAGSLTGEQSYGSLKALIELGLA